MAEPGMNEGLARIMGQAMGYQLSGKYREAQECYRQILKELPEDTFILSEAGGAAILAGDYEGAVPFYDRILTIRPDDPDIMVNKAIALYNARRYPDALAVLNRTVDLYPDHVKAWQKKAMNHNQLEQHDDAISSLTRVTQIQPENPAARVELAIYLFTHAREQEALNLLRRTTGAGPAGDEVRKKLVLTLIHCGFFNIAIAFCDAELSNDPGNCTLIGLRDICTKHYGAKIPVTKPVLPAQEQKKQEALIDQADLCIRNGQLNDALRLLEEARKSEPHSIRLLGMKVSLLQMMKRDEEALACCDEALAIGDEEGLHMQRGDCLALLKRRAEALECFDGVIRKNPGNARAHYLKGLVLEDGGWKEAALKEYGEALRLYPDHAEAKAANARLRSVVTALPARESVNTDLPSAIRHGRDLLVAGRREEAAAWFDNLIASNPSSDQLWVEKGVVLSTPLDESGGWALSYMDEVNASLQCFEKALSLNPLCIDAFIQIGMVMCNHGDFNEAHAALNKALAINPRSAEALMGKAMTCAQAGRFGEAVEYCDRCLNVDSSREEIRTLRDQCEAEQIKPGKREPRSSRSFIKEYPETERSRKLSQVPVPAGSDFSLDLETFHTRFARCCGMADDGRLRVEPDCLQELVRENPECARRYIAWCCSEPEIPLKSLQLVTSVGLVIKVLCGDDRSLEMILKRVKERKDEGH